MREDSSNEEEGDEGRRVQSRGTEEPTGMRIVSPISRKSMSSEVVLLDKSEEGEREEEEEPV